jgi:hypothetical protein
MVYKDDYEVMNYGAVGDGYVDREGTRVYRFHWKKSSTTSTTSQFGPAGD